MINPLQVPPTAEAWIAWTYSDTTGTSVQIETFWEPLECGKMSFYRWEKKWYQTNRICENNCVDMYVC